MPEKQESKRGRPKLPAAKRKGELIGFRVDADERQEIESAADSADQGLSDWCREAVLNAARGVSKQKPKKV